MLAVEVSSWLWPGVTASPQRLFCHVYGRGKGRRRRVRAGRIRSSGAGADEPGNWPAKLRLDGFTYDDLQPYARAKSRPCEPGRLAWLACDARYLAQPYEQLAAYYRRLGQEEEARTVLLAKQRRQRKGLRLPGRSLVGYGYKPSRAFGWLVALLIAGSVYFTLNPPASLDPARHQQFQPVLYTANLVIPIVTLARAAPGDCPGDHNGSRPHSPPSAGSSPPPPSPA